MEQGRIVQVMGPVVDVEFESENLPFLKDALTVENDGKTCVMAVSYTHLFPAGKDCRDIPPRHKSCLNRNAELLVPFLTPSKQMF